MFVVIQIASYIFYSISGPLVVNLNSQSPKVADFSTLGPPRLSHKNDWYLVMTNNQAPSRTVISRLLERVMVDDLFVTINQIIVESHTIHPDQGRHFEALQTR